MPLTDLQVRNASPREKPYKVADGRGLYLLVNPNGSKLWRLKYRYLGKEKLLSFGGYPDVNLQRAREKRDEARAIIADGGDPSRERQEAIEAQKAYAAQTFEKLADEYMEKQVRDGRAERTLEKNRWLLGIAKAEFGQMPVGDVDAPTILKAIRRVEARGTYETAHRLRSIIGTVFRYGVATGVATQDPTYHLKGALIRPTRSHHAALTSWDDLHALMRAIDGYEGQRQTVIGLKLLALLAPRPGELQWAEWKEVDLEEGVWTIPPQRMKMRRPHRVPLPAPAIALLKELHALTAFSGFLFPSVRSPKRPVSENTFNAALRRMGYTKEEMTAHGFRATFSTLANESGLWNPDAIERALAHVEGNDVRRAYARGEHWEERVRMADWWAKAVTQAEVDA